MLILGLDNLICLLTYIIPGSNIIWEFLSSTTRKTQIVDRPIMLLTSEYCIAYVIDLNVRMA